MAEAKHYNLTGVSANVQLGKQGSYITSTQDSISFYASNGSLQTISIANASVSSQAITKAQLDQASAELTQYYTVDIAYNSGTVTVSTVPAGSRVLSITVEIDSPWTAENNTATYVEVGDAGDANRYVREQDVDVLSAGQYYSQYQYKYATQTAVTATITAGTATAGTGKVSMVIASDGV